VKFTRSVERYPTSSADCPDFATLHRMRLRRARWFAYVSRRFDMESFAALADWCAREPGSVDRNEGRRIQALRDLQEGVVLGEFGPPQKPSVAYLPHIVPTDRIGRFPLRLTAFQIGYFRDYGHDLAGDLWAPREVCMNWLSARQIAPPLWLTRPPTASAPRSTTATPQPAQTRKSSASMVQDFVAKFVNTEERQGRQPTQVKLQRAWIDTGHHGRRKDLRDALAQIAGKPKRGRPQQLRNK
jgi:hypothetical protein